MFHVEMKPPQLGLFTVKSSLVISAGPWGELCNQGRKEGWKGPGCSCSYKHFVAVCTWSPASTCSLPGERSSHHDLPFFVSQRCGHSASVLPAEMEGMEAAFIKAAPTSKEQPRRGLECGTHQ